MCMLERQKWLVISMVHCHFNGNGSMVWLCYYSPWWVTAIPSPFLTTYPNPMHKYTPSSCCQHLRGTRLAGSSCLIIISMEGSFSDGCVFAVSYPEVQRRSLSSGSQVLKGKWVDLRGYLTNTVELGTSHEPQLWLRNQFCFFSKLASAHLSCTQPVTWFVVKKEGSKTWPV